MKPSELDKLIAASGKTPYVFFADLLNEHNNIMAAARALGVSREALYKQCEKHGIEITTPKRIVRKVKEIEE